MYLTCNVTHSHRFSQIAAGLNNTYSFPKYGAAYFQTPTKHLRNIIFYKIYFSMTATVFQTFFLNNFFHAINEEFFLILLFHNAVFILSTMFEIDTVKF